MSGDHLFPIEEARSALSGCGPAPKAGQADSRPESGSEGPLGAREEAWEHWDWQPGYGLKKAFDAGYDAALASQVDMAARCERLEAAIIMDLDFYDWYLHASAREVVEHIERRREEVLPALRAALQETQTCPAGCRWGQDCRFGCCDEEACNVLCESCAPGEGRDGS